MYPTLGIALRMFAEIANDRTSLVGKYPSDHQLYELGTYDDATAEFKTFSAPRCHGYAIGYLERSRDSDENLDFFDDDKESNA